VKLTDIDVHPYVDVFFRLNPKHRGMDPDFFRSLDTAWTVWRKFPESTNKYTGYQVARDLQLGLETMNTTSDIIDVVLVRRNTSGDSDLIRELIDVFQQELPKIQSSILAGRQSADGPAIGRAAHKLKGSLLVLGARCSSIAERLEIQALAGFGPSVHDLSTQLELEVNNVVPALRTLLNTGEL
jgi:HPt (histidine-containing phosphotransfer) domain-containing protein